MSEPLVIWQIGDGKPGHENQSMGLIDAIGRLHPCGVHRIDVSNGAHFWSRWCEASSQSKSLPKPDLLVGAGHATHFPLWRLKCQTGASAVVLMKPSLPMSWFDLCIVPRHDFPADTADRDGLVLTEGALNRVVSGDGVREGKLILLGGPSKTHGWDEDEMIESLKRLTMEGEWMLTDSRRTPDGYLRRLKEALPRIQIHPHGETGPNWLPRTLSQMSEVWVTEDSVSMTYEALSSGARVGVLPVPRLRSKSRVLLGLDRMLKQGRLGSFADWLESERELPPAEPLRESDRCAKLVLEKLLVLARKR